MKITIAIDGASLEAGAPAPAPGVESGDGGSAPSTQAGSTTPADGSSRPAATDAGPPPAWLVEAIRTAPRLGADAISGAADLGAVDGGSALGGTTYA